MAFWNSFKDFILTFSLNSFHRFWFEGFRASRTGWVNINPYLYSALVDLVTPVALIKVLQYYIFLPLVFVYILFSSAIDVLKPSWLDSSANLSWRDWTAQSEVSYLSLVKGLFLASRSLNSNTNYSSLMWSVCSFTKPSIEHCLKLTSAYSHYLKESGHPEITTCHSRTAITVDYIFYSAALGDVMAQAGSTITILF